jgi:hypothetical protein
MKVIFMDFIRGNKGPFPDTLVKLARDEALTLEEEICPLYKDLLLRRRKLGEDIVNYRLK